MSFNLETTLKAVARVKLARLLAGANDDEPPPDLEKEAKRLETAAEAWERIVKRQGKDGLKTWKEKTSLLRRYAGPHLGHLAVDDVGPEHVTEALTEARDAGLSKQSVVHLRNALSTVFDDLWREGIIDENPVKRGRMPKKLRHDRRPRISPSDELFAAFMACPDVSEHVHLMALVSRCFGGMRTRDLHAWDWSHIDREAFFSAFVYRPKTDYVENGPAELVEIVIPEELRAPLSAWWTRWQQPETGAVFPRMAGKRAGERQGKRLRRGARAHAGRREAATGPFR